MEVPPDAIAANVVRLEELGHGATGCVYKAVHAATLQLLAVKEVTLPVHAPGYPSLLCSYNVDKAFISDRPL